MPFICIWLDIPFWKQFIYFADHQQNENEFQEIKNSKPSTHPLSAHPFKRQNYP